VTNNLIERMQYGIQAPGFYNTANGNVLNYVVGIYEPGVGSDQIIGISTGPGGAVIGNKLLSMQYVVPTMSSNHVVVIDIGSGSVCIGNHISDAPYATVGIRCLDAALNTFIIGNYILGIGRSRTTWSPTSCFGIWLTHSGTPGNDIEHIVAGNVLSILGSTNLNCPAYGIYNDKYSRCVVLGNAISSLTGTNWVANGGIYIGATAAENVVMSNNLGGRGFTDVAFPVPGSTAFGLSTPSQLNNL
jgi:hypothetical protein